MRLKPDPASFYTGLVAELYEPLAGGITDSGRFIEFVRRQGQPALELCCGTGLPLLDLVEAGLDVDGLDSSSDMLALCEAKARSRGLEVNLYQSRMQDFKAPRTYQCIYIANGSITLLPDDESLQQTFSMIHRCLEPDGVVLIDMDQPDTEALEKYIGRFREVSQDNFVLRVGMTSLEVDENSGLLHIGMRYERQASDGELETSESVWSRRIWRRQQFIGQLRQGGFEVVDEVSVNPELTQLCVKHIAA